MISRSALRKGAGITLAVAGLGTVVAGFVVGNTNPDVPDYQACIDEGIIRTDPLESVLNIPLTLKNLPNGKVEFAKQGVFSVITTEKRLAQCGKAQTAFNTEASSKDDTMLMLTAVGSALTALGCSATAFGVATSTSGDDVAESTKQKSDSVPALQH